MTGLSIAGLLQPALSSDPDIRARVCDRIYPISSVTSTTFPFIVYTRDSISVEYSKDGRVCDSVSCTVFVMTESYMEGVVIAEDVRSALEGFEMVSGNGETRVFSAEFSGAVESFIENTFVQQLQFTFEIG